MWLGGVGLLVAASLVLVVSWLAYRRALPATGFLAMRPSPGLTVEQLRSLNEKAAPWMALSAVPLLVSGAWLVLRRPSNEMTRAVAIVAVVLFGVGAMVGSQIAGGCTGIGSC